jgi:hypothetical protein
MIKGFLVLLNLSGALLSGLFFPGSVTVSQTAPSTAQINNSILVQVTINKGDLNGAAKFIEKLPAGFIAVPVDDEGAQTSSDSNTISFSWSSLPSDAILNISFRVDITSIAAVQSYALTGKFLYTANNQSAETDCGPSNISITGSAAQGSQTIVPLNNISQGGTPIPTGTPAMNSTSDNSPAPWTMQNQTAANNSTPPANNAGTGTGKVFVVRHFSSSTITPKTGATVSLIIHKDNVTGFAKIEDSIPPGFVATAADSKGTSFTFVDNRAKFVWEDLPSDSVITISYHIAAKTNVPGTHIVVGNFSYIFNNTPSTCSIGSTVFNSSVLPGYDYTADKNAPPPPPPVAATATTTVSTPVATQPVVTNTVAVSAPPKVETPVAKNVQVANNPPPANTNVAPKPEVKKVNTPVSANGITYRIQLMALRNPVSLSYFSNRKIKEHVNTETDGGLTKYTIGNYTDYKSVTNAKDNIRSKGFDGAFVVTYKSGVRLSAQEALKINH